MSPFFSLRAGFRQFDEDEIAELLLRVVGDADGRDAALDADPFMVFGEIGRCHEDSSFAVAMRREGKGVDVDGDFRRRARRRKVCVPGLASGAET